MTWQGWVQLAIFAVLTTAAVRPFGGYIARCLDGRSSLARLGAPVEKCISRLAFNTAVSFATNTSWQSYAGETTLGYLTQMTGITVQSFLSAASGIAVAIALVRGFARRSASTIGNFWVDVTRITLYVLLPVCVIGALFLVWQGVPQTLHAYVMATTLEGQSQSIALGPVASQEVIKLLSGDGGGFFNANSAHPFENPTPFTGLVEMLLIFLVGVALTSTFGRMVGDRRQGWALFAAMAAMFLVGAVVVYRAEAVGNPTYPSTIDQSPSSGQSGGNMEGKEVRFGVAQSALFATVSTASSDGAVDSMHDSFMPLSGLVLMANMMVDEVIVGGPGSGLFGILLFAIVAVFIAGLMIGRTPEYLGNKIEANEVKMAMLALLIVPAFILGLPAVAAVLPIGLAGLNNAGPHGFSEMLYAYISGAATNGSAFAGLNANTPFYNLTLAAAMFAGRFLVIIPVLCIAGALVAKGRLQPAAGAMPTHGPLFVALLVGTVLIVGGLTFFPALALGPLAEHFAMVKGILYAAP
jgi:potassium-transporting ATPase potassium-binding subunit